MPSDPRLIPHTTDPQSLMYIKMADLERRLASLESTRPRGVILDMFSQVGTNIAYSSVVNNSEYLCVDAAKTVPLQWSYTPSTDVWAEVTTNMGTVAQVTVAAWHYLQLQQNVTPNPALGYPNTGFATTQGNSGAPYGAAMVTRFIPLAAGVTYLIRNQLTLSANGVFQYYQGPDHLGMYGKVWAR